MRRPVATKRSSYMGTGGRHATRLVYRLSVLCLLLSIGTASILVAQRPLVASAAGTTYTITDLGTLGGANSSAAGINNAGHVTGSADTTARMDAFLWNGTMHDLGTLPGYDAGSRGDAISPSDEVVGYSLNSAGQSHAFYDYTSQMTDLGTRGGASSVAWGIDGSSDVVGTAADANGNSQAFSDDLTEMYALGTLGGSYSNAYGVNPSGSIEVGTSTTASGAFHAFEVTSSMHDLGTLGGSFSAAYAVNNNGIVVGHSDATNGTSPAFLYDGIMHSLGTLGTGTRSDALAINSSNQVVGSSTDDSTSHTHAFFYDGTMHDLNTLIPTGSGWVLDSATGINDKGQIVGEGVINTHYHAFILNPIAAAITRFPSSGAYQSAVTVSGSAFPGNTTVRVYWDSTQTTALATGTTSSSGTFALSIKVPQAVYGLHSIIAVAGSSLATTSFSVQSRVSLVRTSGLEGSANTATGYGFPGADAVRLHWNATNGPLLTASAATTTGLGTTPAVGFTTPAAVPGLYTVYAVDASGHSAAASFRLMPGVHVSPASGARGSSALVSGSNYAPGSTVTIKWNCGTAGCSSGVIVLGSAIVQTNGTFSRSVLIPTATVGTSYTIGALGANSNYFGTAVYSVTS